MRHSFAKIALLCFLVVSLIPAGFAQDSEPQPLALKPVQVSMFKNGVALVRAEVELPAVTEPTVFRVTPLPDSALGSFWVQWSGVSLSNILATQSKTEAQVPAASIPEILEANVGKRLNLRIEENWQQVLIVDYPKRHDDRAIVPVEKNTIPHPIPPARGEIVIVQGEEGTFALPIEWVKAVRFIDNEVPNLNLVQLENVIEFTASQPAQSTDAKPAVGITYLAKGAAWSPSYILDITEKEKAKFSAKAVIINDLIPMEDTATELIAGYPNIRFSEQVDAFSLTPLQSVLAAMGQAGKQVDASALGYQLVSNNRRAGRQDSFFAGAEVMTMADAPVAGQQAEDLYFYQVDSVTLKKGERSYQPLFSAEIPYKHAYTWEIPDFIDNNNFYRQDIAETQQDVWHTLKLTNTHNQPWTTAPAMVMKDGKILGQDMLSYTAPKASADLRLTKVVSISAEQSEQEIQRQRGAAQFNRGSYDLVTVKGELVLINYKDEPMTIEVKKTVSGELQNAGGDPKVIKLTNGLRAVNPKTNLTWTVELKPYTEGEENTVKLEYAYQVYIQS